MTDDSQRRRLIYGRRQGRPLKGGRKAALEQALPSLALDVAGLADPLSQFSGCTMLALEIGFGGGEHLIAQATSNSTTGYIGCEPFINGVANLARMADAEGASNVRIHQGDAREVLEQLSGASLDRAFILFPDPWPKLRHNKRRFVNAETLAQLQRCLKAGGRLRVASDIPDYILWTLSHIARFNRDVGHSFSWTARTADDWRRRPADWPATRYEAKAIAAGRVPAYLEFIREA